MKATGFFFTDERLENVRKFALNNSLNFSLKSSGDLIVTNVSLDYGPIPTDSERYQEYAKMIDAARQAEQSEVDALVVCGIDDPGLEVLREATNILVVGAPQVTFGMAEVLKCRFGVLMHDKCAPIANDLALEHCQKSIFAGCHSVDLSELDAQNQLEDAQARLNKRALEMVKDRSEPEVILLSCGSFPGCGEAIKAYLLDKGFKVKMVIDAISRAVAVAECSLSENAVRFHPPPSVGDSERLIFSVRPSGDGL